MLLKLLICAIIILSIYSIFLLLSNKTLKQHIKMLNTMPPSQTIFDPIAGQIGMKPIYDFLKTVYLKYINSILIQYNENTELSVTQFLADHSDNESMTKIVTGYELTVEALISKQLKSYFCKYYNVLDNDGNVNNNFNKFVSEWFILNIRALQAQTSLSKRDSNDYSVEKEKLINAKIFMGLELDLYKDLNIIEESNLDQTQLNK